MQNTFKTFDEQIELLEKNKSFNFESKEEKEEFKKILMMSNYINVINPYKIYFFDNKIGGVHNYPNPIKSKDNLYYYDKDSEYAHRLLKDVFMVETFLATLIAYHVSQELNHNPNYFNEIIDFSFYTVNTNAGIDLADIKLNYYTKEFQSRLKLLSARFSSSTFSDFERAYQVREFQKLVNKSYGINDISSAQWFYKITFLSFEHILFLFKILKRETQQKIIKETGIKFSSVEDFNDITRNIKNLRNKLAHQENLTIIINKQLYTDAKAYILKGSRAMNTIKNIYKFLNKEMPDYVYDLEKLFHYRKNKYIRLGLVKRLDFKK